MHEYKVTAVHPKIPRNKSVAEQVGLIPHYSEWEHRPRGTVGDLGGKILERDNYRILILVGWFEGHFLQVSGFSICKMKQMILTSNVLVRSRADEWKTCIISTVNGSWCYSCVPQRENLWDSPRKGPSGHQQTNLPTSSLGLSFPILAVCCFSPTAILPTFFALKWT